MVIIHFRQAILPNVKMDIKWFPAVLNFIRKTLQEALILDPQGVPIARDT